MLFDRILGGSWRVGILLVWFGVCAAEANAGFISYGSATASGTFIPTDPSDPMQMTNTVDLSGIMVQRSVSGLLGSASAFAQVSPRLPGEQTNVIVAFRTSAIAHMNGIVGFGFGDSAFAEGTALWDDGLRFETTSGIVPPVHGWAVIMRSNGSLEVTGAATASHMFQTLLGNGSGVLFHELTSPGSRSVENEMLLVSSTGGDPFDPSGIRLFSQVIVHADASNGNISQPIRSDAEVRFGHTTEFLGIVALDANGNVMSGVGGLVSVTSDSGLNYPILDAIPTANPAATTVPEPSSLVLLTMLAVLVALAGWSRRKWWAPSPVR